MDSWRSVSSAIRARALFKPKTFLLWSAVKDLKGLPHSLYVVCVSHVGTLSDTLRKTFLLFVVLESQH